MATPKDPELGNLVRDILVLGFQIPDTAVGHLQELRKLILQLPSAPKAEREAASEQLSKIATSARRTPRRSTRSLRSALVFKRSWVGQRMRNGDSGERRGIWRTK